VPAAATAARVAVVDTKRSELGGAEAGGGGGPIALLGVDPSWFRPPWRGQGAAKGGPAPACGSGGAVVGCRLRRSREVMGIRVGQPVEAGVHGQGGTRAHAPLTARVSMGAARHRPPLRVGHPQFLTVVIVLEFSIGARHTLCGLGCFYFHFGSMFCYLLYDLISSFWLEDLRLKFL
jgi:hypothetical protein